MPGGSSQARAGRGASATTAAASTTIDRFVMPTSNARVARAQAGWLAAAVSRGGWLGALLGQDELVGPRDAQAVLLAAMDDDDLAPALEERGARKLPFGRGRRGLGHHASPSRICCAR